MSDEAARVLAQHERDEHISVDALPVSRARLSAAERAQRDRRIMALAAGGASPERIADVIGCSVNIVKAAIKRAIHAGQRSGLRELETVRELELQRLDAMLLAIWPKVQEGNLRAIDRALTIGKQRARLAGLERESEGKQANHVHLHGVTQEDVEAMTAAWRQSRERALDVPEADVVDEDPAELGNEAIEALADLPAAGTDEQRAEP